MRGSRGIMPAMTKSIVLAACAAMAAVSFLNAAPQAPAPAPAAPAGPAARGPAQAPPAHLVEEVQRMYTAVQNNILAAADQFPEDKYTWQPTPDVRSWARLIGHLTD